MLHFFVLIHGLPYLVRWSLYAFYMVLATAYVHRCVIALHRPLPRLVASLPVLFANSLLPRVFFSFPRRELLEIAVAWGMCSWIASFRLLALCFAHGAASDARLQQPFSSFLVALFFPARVKIRAAGLPLAGTNGTTAAGVESTKSPAVSSKTATNGDYQQLAASGDASAKPPPTAEQRPLLQAAAEGSIKLLLAFLVALVYSPLHPPALVALLQAALFFLLASAGSDALPLLLAAVAPSLVALPLFRAPFLAQSLRDFWARRWNLTVSACLRETVYDAVVALLAPQRQQGGSSGSSSGASLDSGVAATSGASSCAPLLAVAGTNRNGPQAAADLPRKNATGQPQPGGAEAAGVSSGTSLTVQACASAPPACPPPEWVRTCAVLASFLVSGLMHETLVLQLAGRVTGHMLLFFLLHGALTVAEAAAAKAAPKLRCPPFVAVPATLAVLLATAQLLFLRPLTEAHVFSRMAEQVVGALGRG